MYCIKLKLCIVLEFVRKNNKSGGDDPFRYYLGATEIQHIRG